MILLVAEVTFTGKAKGGLFVSDGATMPVIGACVSIAHKPRARMSCRL